MAPQIISPRVIREVERPINVLGRIGDQAWFFGKAFAGAPYAVRFYRREVVRLIAEISMGTGTLVIGGTVVIVGFLTVATGYAGGPRLQLLGQHRHRGVDRVFIGIHQ